ncbi:MAG: AraC family transcriptional regulator [Ilumatobacter sp.]
MDDTATSTRPTADARTPNESNATTVPLIADPLAEALHFMRMEGVFYCRSELTAPWGISMPALPDSVYFHVVTSGEMWLIDADGAERLVRSGDLVVVPHGRGHDAVDAVGSAATSVFDIPHDYVSRQYAVLRHGGGGDPATVICGAIQFKHPAARSLLELLPEVIHVTSSTTRHEWRWMSTLLDLMAHESAATKPGGEAVVTRLSDILVIQAIRHWITTDPAASTGWLGALGDPSIGHSIAMVHREPERPWTVADMASGVAMSRSSFAARFTELVGEPPVQYVTRWRMHLAVDLLSEEGLTVAATAERLGYTSEASFGRAFKRVVGHAPGGVRASRPDRA